MKTLRPIAARRKYEIAIEKLLMAELNNKLFAPIFYALDSLPKAAMKQNASPADELKKAVHDGKLIYDGNVFSGSFSAKTTKALKALGAKWIQTRKVFSLTSDKIPADLKGEIVKARIKTTEVSSQINAILSQAQLIGPAVDFNKATETTLEDLHVQIKATIPESIEIPLVWKGYIGNKLTTEYSENLELDIKKWYDEEILRLRKQVQANATKGYRASNLVKAIEAEYDVSRNKARFLARQETTLLVSKYREATYTAMGLDEYVWSTSLDKRVRPEHRVMHGKTCRWDNPNVYWNGRVWADRSDIGGVKKHPGEDWQCRCVAKPLLKQEGLNV